MLELARRTLAAEMARRPVFDSPQAVRDFLRLELAELGHEVFAVLFLDAQHRLIRFEPMFRGTLTQTSVYPREVLKRALALDAAAVILAHNHPSGVAEPSKADEFLTQSLKTALQMIDVRVLDHFVVGRGPVVMLPSRGCCDDDDEGEFARWSGRGAAGAAQAPPPRRGRDRAPCRRGGRAPAQSMSCSSAASARWCGCARAIWPRSSGRVPCPTRASARLDEAEVMRVALSDEFTPSR